MGKEDAIEVVTPADPEKGQTSAPAHVESEKSGCAPCICCSSADGSPDASHVLSLRIVGAVTFVFGVVEFGLGGGLFNFLENAKMGAWWVGVIVAIAGICAMVSTNKAWISSTFVLSAASCVVAIVGAAYDGVYSHKFRSIQACSSVHDETSMVYNWGNTDRYADSQACLLTAELTDFTSDACYCSTKTRCYEYILSSYAKAYNQNCGSIIVTYSNTMATSCAFCVFCFCFVLALSILSGSVLFCSERIPGAKKAESKDHIPEETVVADAPAEAAVVPSAEVAHKVGGSSVIA